jgi:hypothetical protein
VPPASKRFTLRPILPNAIFVTAKNFFALAKKHQTNREPIEAATRHARARTFSLSRREKNSQRSPCTKIGNPK